MNVSHKQVTPKYSDYVITHHAMQRMYERFGISSKTEIQKMVKAARDKGVFIHCLNKDNYEKMGLDKETYNYLKKNTWTVDNKNRCCYYKDKIWVLRGNHSRTLVTVIKVDINKNGKVSE